MPAPFSLRNIVPDLELPIKSVISPSSSAALYHELVEGGTREERATCRDMGRGKIEMKMIENDTNRQVTYSKRRNGIMKKAQELTILCDAKVSLIMFSSSGRCHEYTSPATTTKEIYDLYQKTQKIDLWKSHYEKMQEMLEELKEINSRLRSEIRHRLGEDLNDLSIPELHALEQKMDSSLAAVRGKKYHTIKTKTDTARKKVNNLENQHRKLLFALREMGYDMEDPHYGLMENDDHYESAFQHASGSNVYAYNLHPNCTDLHLSAGNGFGSNDLRLG